VDQRRQPDERRAQRLATSTTYSWQVRAVNGPDVTQADGGTWWGFTIESGQPGLPFADGFESGDTSAWSATVRRPCSYPSSCGGDVERQLSSDVRVVVVTIVAVQCCSWDIS